MESLTNYVKVSITLITGITYFGQVNIIGHDRTSEFFDEKFKKGGNIQITNAHDGNQTIGNRSMNRGFNASHITSWTPVKD